MTESHFFSSKPSTDAYKNWPVCLLGSPVLNLLKKKELSSFCRQSRRQRSWQFCLRQNFFINFHLSNIFGNDLHLHKRGVAHFDARVFSLPKPEELLNNLLWRCRYDCQRNSESAFARAFMTSKETHKIHTDEQISRVREQYGQDYGQVVPLWAQFGSLVKREMFNHTGVNPKTGDEESTLRTRMMTQEIKIDKFSEENLDGRC